MKQARTASSAAQHTPATAVYSTVNYPSRRTGDEGFGRILWRIVIFLLCLSSAGAALAADRPTIREVLISKEGNGARIEIRANQPLVYRSYLMPELDKWVIDLPGAKTTYSGDDPHRHWLEKKFAESRKNRNIAELGIGTNDRATRPDNVLEAEKILGTVHIAFGDNTGFGGTVSTPFHEDYVLYKPTLVGIRAEGSRFLLLDNGKLQV